ncbi:MAG: nucleoside kinase [Lachnospiraceae bacterium]|nr:nucleoside kinase [Lachnospiraceae bacterium]
MKRIELQLEGRRRQVPEGTVLERLAREYRKPGEPEIVLALVDGKLQELHKTLKRSCTVRFLTTADASGMRTYERSAQLLMNKAIYDVTPSDRLERVTSQFSVTGGIYVEIQGDFPLDTEWLARVRARMWELVEADLPIQKTLLHVNDAMALFRRTRMYSKEKLFRYRRSSYVNVYSLDGFVDYHYGYMVPSTGYLRAFDLELYHGGLVLRLPERKNPDRVAPYRPSEKLFAVMKESTAWDERMHLSTVGDLNDQIAGGHAQDMILVAEARQEKQIADIAEAIARHPDRKIILIAGPSSSGKTSFSHRLSIQLRVQGLTPHPIAVDDYFVDREKNPRDADGNYDFEALECVDISLFNRDMNALLAGETVELPSFNFVQGKREYRGDFLRIGSGDILVIEGIHCLNDRLTEFLPAESRFKIYISALTQLNIDEHNRIPTTDGRLIRRMIRDARTRGTTAAETLARWGSVRRGEERNIFPYQETADVMFNSSLIYEFSVMKPYAEQLLFGIPRDAPEYREAKRLLKFFDYFLAVDSRDIPGNSLLKEFIGGSIFRV